MLLSPLLPKWGIWDWSKTLFFFNLKGLRWDTQTVAICRDWLCTLLWVQIIFPTNFLISYKCSELLHIQPQLLMRWGALSLFLKSFCGFSAKREMAAGRHLSKADGQLLSSWEPRQHPALSFLSLGLTHLCLSPSVLALHLSRGMPAMALYKKSQK